MMKSNYFTLPNSRPLLSSSNNPNNFDALTRNNFIIKKLHIFMPRDFNDDNITSAMTILDWEKNVRE